MRAVGTDGPGFTLAHLLTLIAQEQHRHHVDLIKRVSSLADSCSMILS